MRIMTLFKIDLSVNLNLTVNTDKVKNINNRMIDFSCIYSEVKITTLVTKGNSC